MQTEKTAKFLITARIQALSFKACDNTAGKKTKPYYLTRPKTPEETALIKKERRNARILMGTAVGGGILGTICYFTIKLLRFK